MTEPSKTRKRLRLLAIMAGSAFLLLVLTIVLVIWQPTWFLPYALNLFSLSGQNYTAAEIRIDLSPLRIEADKVIVRKFTGLDLQVDHLVAEPDALAWWRGQTWLNLLELDGLHLSLHGQPQNTSQPLDLSLLSYLLVTRDIKVARASLTVALPEYRIDVESLDVSITPADEQRRRMNLSGLIQVHGADRQTLLSGRLRGLGQIEPASGLACRIELIDAQAELPWVQGPFHGESSIRLDQNTLTLSQVKLNIPEGSFRPFPKIETSPLGLALLASAEINLPDTAWLLRLENMKVGGFLEARGSFNGHGQQVTEGSLSGTVLETADLLEAFQQASANIVPDLDLQGSLPFRISLHSRDHHQTLEAVLSPEKFKAETRDLKVDLTGLMEISGPPDGPWSLGGRLQAEGAYKKSGYTVESFALTAPLSGNLTAPEINGFELEIGENRVLYDGHPLALGAVTARGDFSVKDGEPAVAGVTIQSAALGIVSGSAGLAGEVVRADVSGTNLNVTRLSSLLAAFTGLPVKGWQINGRAGLALTIAPEDEHQMVSVKADLAGLSFQNGEATIIGQKIKGRISFQTALEPDTPITLDLRIIQGEALWNTVYTQFKPSPLRLTVKGTPTDGGGLRDFQIRSSWANLGELRAFGSVRPAGSGWYWQGRAEVTKADLKPIFETFVRQPLIVSYPAIDSMAVAGQAALKLNFAGKNSGTSINGELRLNNVAVSQGDREPLLENTNLALPFSYVFGTPAKAESKKNAPGRTGRLEIRKIHLGTMSLGPLDLPIRLTANRLNLDKDITLPIWGGKATLTGLYVNQPLSPDFVAHFGLSLDRLDLSQIPLEQVKLDGRLDNRTVSASVSTDLLRVDGALTGQAFGGRLELDNISVLRPFGSNRELKLDLKAEQVDMEKLSQALRVGRITGLVNIGLTGLSVAHGLPVAFHLILKSVPEAREDRTVSLQAVNSISVVGTGAGLTGVGVSLFKGFFENLPYREIGIECILKNDVFTVSGLIHEDGVEYLVKRPTFMGVNVVNGNPNNRIGFSEMLNRIRRVVENPGSG